jgi:SAM-dependent methyltransferase
MIAAPDRAVTWHDVECGAYVADLPVWSQLARETAGPVLDLGSGTGRVALHLAAQGFEVTALDHAPELLAALSARAHERGLSVEAVRGDARDFSLSHSYALVIAPMQLAHVVGGAGARSSMLAAVRGHLCPGGRAAFALLGERPPADPDAPPPLPDVLDRDGWVFSSQPLEVVTVDGGLEIRRLRQLVSPAGELASELDAVRLDDLDADQLAAEAHEAGFREVERLEIPATRDHVDSTVCVLEAS